MPITSFVPSPPTRLDRRSNSTSKPKAPPNHYPSTPHKTRLATWRRLIRSPKLTSQLNHQTTTKDLGLAAQRPDRPARTRLPSTFGAKQVAVTCWGSTGIPALRCPFLSCIALRWSHCTGGVSHSLLCSDCLFPANVTRPRPGRRPRRALDYVHRYFNSHQHSHLPRVMN